MVADIDCNKWIKLLNRRVQHYGYEFKYGTNNVDTNSKIGELPSFCDVVKPRMASVLEEFQFEQDKSVHTGKGDYYDKMGMFDQLTLNDYVPGQGIPPHVDTHSPFEEIFASLSLLSGVTMHFKTPENVTRQVGGPLSRAKKSHLLPKAKKSHSFYRRGSL